jgi:DNA repair exonuclease SbcCD ATPase subunit
MKFEQIPQDEVKSEDNDMKAELIQLEERREELNKESAELKNILEDNVPRMRSRINRLAEILQDFHASEEEASQIRADIDGLKNEIDDMRRLGKTREILRSSGFDEVEDLRFVSSGGMLRLTPDLDAVYGLLSRFKTSMGETVEDIDRERLSVDNSIEDKKNELSGVLGESEEQENIGDDTDEAKEVESESKEDPEDNNAEAEQEAEELHMLK